MWLLGRFNGFQGLQKDLMRFEADFRSVLVGFSEVPKGFEEVQARFRGFQGPCDISGFLSDFGCVSGSFCGCMGF